MNNFQRREVGLILDKINRKMPVFQVITGPRQVGKTTAVTQIMERFAHETLYASADAPTPVGPEWIDSQWLLAEQKVEETGKPVLLVLDSLPRHGTFLNGKMFLILEAAMQ